MKNLERILIAATLLLSCLCLSAQEKEHRLGENHLFMPKGAISVGLQCSYIDLNASDASVMLFLQQLNASGSYFGIGPYFSYTYKDNKSIGLRVKYSNAQGGIAGLDLTLPGNDMELGLDEMNASSSSFMTELFHRSYMGLDTKGRFGLFVDIALQYSNSITALSAGPRVEGNYTKMSKLKAAVRPGLEVFVMNNVSSVFSIGIGGVTLSRSRNYEDSQIVGSRTQSNARFMPDVTDITMGIAVHF